MNRFDSIAADWDKDEARVRMAEGIAEAMLAHLDLRPGLILMDYGTGTGIIALKMAPRVLKVIAVDNSKGMLHVLKRKISRQHVPNVEPLQGSLEDAAKRPNMDVIVSSMVLHHVPDTALAVKTFFNLLKPGGQIAVADLDQEDGGFHGDSQEVPHSGFKREDLRAIFTAAGFASVEFYEAYTLVKTTAEGQERSFPIFLMTAVKPSANP